MTSKSWFLRNRSDERLLEISSGEVVFTQRAIEQFGDEWRQDVGDLLQHGRRVGVGLAAECFSGSC